MKINISGPYVPARRYASSEAHGADSPAVRVLTVRQPHAHLLIHGSPNAGIKHVENRPKPTQYRGILLIQASAKVDQAAYAAYIAEGIYLPPAEELVNGAIIGSVQVIGCLRDSRSRWAIPGYWHWLTAAPRAADPVIPIKGQLSIVPRAGRLGGIVPPARLGAMRRQDDYHFSRAGRPVAGIRRHGSVLPVSRRRLRSWLSAVRQARSRWLSASPSSRCRVRLHD